MSYRCQQCSEVQPSNTRQNYTVVKSRPQTYKNFKVEFDDQGRPQQTAVFSSGWEIQKALTLCTKCSLLHQNQHTNVVLEKVGCTNNGFPIINLHGLMFK